MEIQIIKSKLDQLPEELKKEALDYIDFLLQKGYGTYKITAKKSKFKFNWEGGLSNLKEKYTPVELQHKALEWR